MKNLGILNTVTRTFHQTCFQVKKHSPEILIVAGIVGTVASAVMACKATLKVNDILEDTKTQVEQVNTVIADETIPEEKYSEEDVPHHYRILDRMMRGMSGPLMVTA